MMSIHSRTKTLAALLIVMGLMLLTVGALAQEKENPPAPGDLSADEVAKRIQAFYKKTQDFHAGFTQTFTDIAAGSKKVSLGKVYFKKPGKMRWDYYDSEKPTKREKLLVSDGDIFWVYEYDFKQVFKQCLKESKLPTSLSFLMGEGDLLEEFDITFAKNSTAEAPHLLLTPQEPTSKYKQLIFEVDPETFQVKRTVVFDPYGNTNELVFQGARINKNLPDSGFDFTPPKDSRLLNPQKKCP